MVRSNNMAQGRDMQDMVMIACERDMMVIAKRTDGKCTHDGGKYVLLTMQKAGEYQSFTNFGRCVCERKPFFKSALL